MAMCAVDALIVVESFALALLFRFGGNVDPFFWRMFWPFALFSALAFVLLLAWNGVYRSEAYAIASPPHQLRSASLGLYEDARLLGAAAIAAGGLFLVVFAVGPGGFSIIEFNPVPLTVPLVGSVLAYAQLIAVRLIAKLARGSRTVN